LTAIEGYVFKIVHSTWLLAESLSFLPGGLPKYPQVMVVGFHWGKYSKPRENKQELNIFYNLLAVILHIAFILFIRSES
jgi:hypothetical protein